MPARRCRSQLQRAPYADDIRKAFGAEIFDEPSKAYAGMLTALERFELEDPSFHPYNSKYDDYLDGKVQTHRAGAARPRFFDDPKRGNCAILPSRQKRHGRFAPALHRLRV